MNKVSLLTILYLCQGLPGGFLAVALPLLLREKGASLTIVGFSTLLSLPWLLKFLWAPLADRYFFSTFGKRKTWIIPAHIGMITCTLWLAQIVETDRLQVVGLLFLILNLFAATQDIGVDGLAVDCLGEEELGKGNAAQVGGFKLGNILGGGVLLSLSEILGWSLCFYIMALAVFAAMTALLFTTESSLYSPSHSQPSPPGHLRELIKGFGSLGWPFLAFLFYVKFGETLSGTLVKPVLLDLGITKAQIGVLDGIFGGVATIAGALTGAWLYRRIGLLKAFAVNCVAQGVFLIVFRLASIGGISFPLAVILNSLENLAGGAVGVCVFAFAMAHCSRSVGASQFTACQCLYMLGAFAAGPLSGFLADQIGAIPVMILGGLLAISIAGILQNARFKDRYFPQ